MEACGNGINLAPELQIIGRFNMHPSSYSKLMAFEASRILHRLGCDVRIFNPSELPIRDSVDATHPSVQELRSLSLWSDGHIWCSPEQYGNLTAVFGD
jgi:arsenical resistance protein ArsH